MSRTVIMGSTITLAIIVGTAAYLLIHNANDGPNGHSGNSYLQAMDEDARARFIQTIEDGGLAIERLPEAAASYRAISESRCTGVITSVSDSMIVLERLADGATWQIDISPQTGVSRGGKAVAPGDLETGEVVEILSQDGITALIIVSYKEALRN